MLIFVDTFGSKTVFFGHIKKFFLKNNFLVLEIRVKLKTKNFTKTIRKQSKLFQEINILKVLLTQLRFPPVFKHI